MYQCSKHQPSKLRIKDVIFCLSVGNITEVRTVTTQPKTWIKSKVIIGRSKHGKKKSGAIFSERYLLILDIYSFFFWEKNLKIHVCTPLMY